METVLPYGCTGYLVTKTDALILVKCFTLKIRDLDLAQGRFSELAGN